MRYVLASAVCAVLFMVGCREYSPVEAGSTVVEGNVVSAADGPKFYSRDFVNTPNGRWYYDLFEGTAGSSTQIDLGKYPNKRLRISTRGPNQIGLSTVKILKVWDN